MGKYVHGNKPPYGYDRNRQLQKLVINEDEKEVIRTIVDYYLEGMSITDIAWELNKRKIPSPAGAKWQVTTISRILKSEVYLGRIIGNKTEGNHNRVKSSTAKPFRRLNRENWIIIENCHQPIITKEEHEKIMDKFDKQPKKIYNNSIYSLTGLVKCDNCGKTMNMKRRQTGYMSLKKCECGNNGGTIDIIEDAIYQTALALKDKLNQVRTDDVEKQKEYKLNEQLETLVNEHEKQDNAIERIEEAFENGLYDIQKTRKKTKEREDEKWRIEGEISKIKKQISSVSDLNNKERISSIDNFIQEISDGANHERRNKIYKDLINDIRWRKDNEQKRAVIDINFL